MKFKLKVRLKGGPGSGNWGHAGRPGKVGGSAPGGGLGTIGARAGSTAEERAELSAKTRKERRESTRKVAEKFGFDPNRVRYGGSGQEQRLGNMTGTYIASYDPNTEMVSFFDGSFGEYGDDSPQDRNYKDINESVAAHEFTHYAWHMWMRQAIIERGDMERRQPRPDTEPALTLFYDWLKNESRLIRLRREDGVTEYSTDFWSHYNRRGGAQAMKNAINETLAEISFLKASGKSLPPDARLWKQFYSEFMELANQEGYGIHIPE